MKRVALIVAFALSIAACGAEQLQEQIAEEAIGGDANVDIELGDDGEVSVNVESDEGSFAIGSGASLPGSLTVPVPDGGDVASSFEESSSVGTSLMYPEDRYDEIVGFYESWTSGSGDEWQTSTSTFEMEGETQRSTQWASTGNAIFILVGDCVDINTGEFSSVCVTINQNL